MDKNNSNYLDIVIQVEHANSQITHRCKGGAQIDDVILAFASSLVAIGYPVDLVRERFPDQDL